MIHFIYIYFILNALITGLCTDEPIRFKDIFLEARFYVGMTLGVPIVIACILYDLINGRY